VIHGNASSVDACYDFDLDSNASSNRGRRGAEFARYPLNGHVDRFAMYAAGIPFLFTAKDRPSCDHGTLKRNPAFLMPIHVGSAGRERVKPGANALVDWLPAALVS